MQRGRKQLKSPTGDRSKAPKEPRSKSRAPAGTAKAKKEDPELKWAVTRSRSKSRKPRSASRITSLSPSGRQGQKAITSLSPSGRQGQKAIVGSKMTPGGDISWEEKKKMALLVLLYSMQAIPLGLTSGSIPFMLQSKLSFTQVGFFSLSSYPYSLKLFWSPIVDSVFSPRVGRRKSWVIPVQFVIAAVLIVMSAPIQRMYEAADVSGLTATFFAIVFLAATQDIAVDGWALTLLSSENVELAATCQTIGMNIGFFLSFTFFLALTSGKFCDTYLRSSPLLQKFLGFTGPGSELPLVSLSGYLSFWGWVFALVTFLLIFVPEDKAYTDEEENERAKRSEGIELIDLVEADQKPVAINEGAARKRGRPRKVPLAVPAAPAPISFSSTPKPSLWREVASAYYQLWEVCKLPAVWGLGLFVLTYRVGLLPVEAAYSLKLIDKGVSKETLSFMVLFQMPMEFLAAILAGRWASKTSPYLPFMMGFCGRLVLAPIFLLLVTFFPPGAASLAEHPLPFALLGVSNLLHSFSQTLTFTAIGSLFNKVSDPAMGGAYLTLLNTIANIGYLIYKGPLFYFIDLLTIPECKGAVSSDPALSLSLSCPKKLKDMTQPSACVDAGGTCSLAQDGFFVLGWSFLIIGVATAVIISRTMPKLMSLPESSWRIRGGKSKA